MIFNFIYFAPITIFTINFMFFFVFFPIIHNTSLYPPHGATMKIHWDLSGVTTTIIVVIPGNQPQVQEEGVKIHTLRSGVIFPRHHH